MDSALNDLFVIAVVPVAQVGKKKFLKIIADRDKDRNFRYA
ncbi:hypothetical protein [Maribacter aquimaris]|nr:hypothetical protein [Maribacter aquimaris]